ncbi:hypothetical protein Ga0466249_002479 [Sporomusaceae bacterium BoRhaA]|nr:hypothetical protein [Pelorhabdus rhamnosifermentans]
MAKLVMVLLGILKKRTRHNKNIMKGGIFMFKAASKKYLSNGVIVKPSNPEKYQNVTIVYNGLLAQSGACEVYAHVGFGKHWQGSRDIKMIRTSSGFEATIQAANADSLNVAFKDPINNWDNNSCMNYSFNIKN